MKKGKKVGGEKRRAMFLLTCYLLSVYLSSLCSMVAKLSYSEELTDMIVILGDSEPEVSPRTWFNVECQCLLDRVIGAYLGNKAMNIEL